MIFDIDYLNELIANGIEENSELEYKSAAALQRDDKKITEATKDVSAFANSKGGLGEPNPFYKWFEKRTVRAQKKCYSELKTLICSKKWFEFRTV